MTREVEEARSAEAEREPDSARQRLQRASAELLGAHTYLVSAMARRYRRAGVDPSDLAQDGSIGLLRAVEKFDPSMGHRFGVYAAWWIRQHIFRAIADYGRTIRVPLPMMEANRRVSRARRVFEGRFGRAPDPLELAEAAGVDSETAAVAGSIVDEPVSLHGRIGDSETELIDVLADTSTAPPDEELASARLRGRLYELLDALTFRERAVLRLRFGLEGAPEHSLQETAASMGLSRERVRRIEVRALAKLRAWAPRGGLADYLAA